MEAEQKQPRRRHGVSLPEDIVFDVLARLPAKVLCRFRCVSKAWRALISDPTFVAAHRSHAGGAHLVRVFLTCTWPPEVRVMDMDANVVRRLEVRPLGKQDNGDDVSGVLQQQATTTPLNVIVYRKQPIGATAMIVDPAAGRACTVDTYTPVGHMLSIGRATPSGSLKVLRVEPSRQQICTVATIVDDGGAEPLRWRRRSAPPFVTSWYPRSRATVNGVVYFLPHVCDAASSSGMHRVASFKLESEEWKMINGPPLGIEEHERPTLTEHKQTLGFVQSLRERNDVGYYYAIVWILIDYNESVWVKDCIIQMPKTWELTKHLGALDDGRILLLVSEWVTDFIDHFERQFLVFYNPSTKTFTESKDKATLGYRDIVVLYTGSLLS